VLDGREGDDRVKGRAEGPARPLLPEGRRRAAVVCVCSAPRTRARLGVWSRVTRWMSGRRTVS
jgi:hypothetical protein